MCNFLKSLTFALIIIGAVNWGLIGLFEFDLVAKIFGNMTILTRLVYSLVGLSAIIYFIINYVECQNKQH